MKKSFLLLISVCISALTLAQQTKTSWDSVNFSGVKLRSVGPAFMTGRIADVAIDPKDESHYYVAVGSGGVWETKNAGTTFDPIFEGQKVYSIGCITIDPNNSSTIWLGTGENVGGRHISFGDGIYVSRNGGKTWTNMGLEESEHISKIVVHPTNPDIVWVACQGPLWNKGGERGVYKTSNGGKDWKKVLGDSEWIGATDLLIDPRNPMILYAATWQRHRTVASYIGGGPQTAIYKSLDGGDTWTELKTGLPSGNKGKIGLAISPQNPDVLYAAIELNLKKGAVYRSENQGANWIKMSDQISGGTGPHYYQELYACPHSFDRIYMANNYLLVSDNGGKDFRNVKNQHKHVDNHTVVFKQNDPDYLMVGTDGGLFESFDLAKNWKHMGNLPITQFYKLAVDDAEPFYNIYGGTQDNNTQGGPSRTDNKSGIDDNLWQIVLGGDGHQPATEPGNPSILYAQSQQGYYNRVDLVTGERVSIRPQPREGENYDRYNWDAPILVSHHNPSTIYVASHRLWKSENRGDSWIT
ncbi:MAG: glycosyl hydrolase, partial [Bacteroidia bacterium]|nr:glycosyl hydrolase [Bacteroidia bacterium]